MAKNLVLADLQRRVVPSEATANRIGDAMCLLAKMAARHDDRVKHAYGVWLDRAARYEEANDFSEDAAMRFLFECSVQLNALVREVKLHRYQSWLPKALLWEFYRAIEGGTKVTATVPEGLEWERRTNKPKQKAGAMGGFRLENVEQHVERFYLCEVLGVKKKALARSAGCTRADVQHSIKRARLLLDCVNAVPPTDGEGGNTIPTSPVL